MIAEIREPSGAAQPIGYKVSLNHIDVRYAPGIRIIKMEIRLWIKEIPDFPMPQKYPLKTKCTPAKMQSTA